MPLRTIQMTEVDALIIVLGHGKAHDMTGYYTKHSVYLVKPELSSPDTDSPLLTVSRLIEATPKVKDDINADTEIRSRILNGI